MPQPAEATIALFNELVALPLSQQDRIAQIAWKLRGLKVKQPKNADLKVALAQAVIMQGERDEAVHLLRQAFSERFRMSVQAQNSLLGILVNIGLRTEASALAREQLNLPAFEAFRRDQISALMVPAFFEGDLESLKATAALAAKITPKAVPFTEPLMKRLDEEGLLPYFAEHQKILWDLTKDHTLCMYISACTPDDGAMEVASYFFVGGDRALRSALADKMDDAIDSLCERNGLPSGAFVPVLRTVVMDIRAHWPMRTANVAH